MANWLSRKSSGVDKAAKALATAGGVAHLTFLTMFGWRIVTAGPLMRFAWIGATIAALVGLVAEFVGWALVKHGGRTPAKKLGYTAIAASTIIAGVLLAIASW